MTLPERILSHARTFVGLCETKSNAEWDDPSTPGIDASARLLRASLIASGWQSGWAYCAAFVEAIWAMAYAEACPAQLMRVKGLLTVSVMQSFRNCQKENLISQKPVPGAIFFMQNGKSWTGHAGLVVKADSERFWSIEANTSPAPGSVASQREGDGVYDNKQHRISFTPRPGLWLRGFLHPLE
jgi:hypothetical protein